MLRSIGSIKRKSQVIRAFQDVDCLLLSLIATPAIASSISHTQKAMRE